MTHFNLYVLQYVKLCKSVITNYENYTETGMPPVSAGESTPPGNSASQNPLADDFTTTCPPAADLNADHTCLYLLSLCDTSAALLSVLPFCLLVFDLVLTFDLDLA